MEPENSTTTATPEPRETHTGSPTDPAWTEATPVTIPAEITRDEFEMLAAEVATAKHVASEAYALARQIHLFLKGGNFQYATLVDALNEQADK